METHKTSPTPVERPHRSSGLLVLSIISLLLVAAAGVYLTLQKSALLEEQKVLDADIVSLNTEIDALEELKVQSAQLAQQFLASVEKDEVQWSRVITRIQSLLPVDSATQQSKFVVISYNGSAGGKLTLNMETVPTALEPFPTLAELLATFNGSSFFTNAYVPNISRGETDDGKKLLTFTLNLVYDEDKVEADTVKSLTGGATQESVDSKPKVSRNS